MKARGIVAAVAAFVAAHAGEAHACSVCFGDPTTPQNQAMRVGIFVLLGFIGSVLVGFGSLFLYWMSRSRRLALLEKGAIH